MRDEDAKDLPIELRKVDDYDYSSVGLKSRSLGSILYPAKSSEIKRSQSSVPSLGGSAQKHVENIDAFPLSKENHATKECTAKKPNFRPKLMKQKQSITDDNNEDINFCEDIKSQFLRKQSSLNEELMAESRIREKERIRKKIQKQVSLNETFLYRSLLTKRLQVIREGFTSKFKKSTGSLERITKNGFVNIIKNMKSGSSSSNLGSEFSASESKEPIFIEKNHMRRSSREFTIDREKMTKCCFKSSEFCEKTRRPSESDSSKESSLQSDTSVESEDSFASVIHNPTLMPTSPLALSTQSPTYSQTLQKNDAFTFEAVDKKIINENLRTNISSSNLDKTVKIPTASCIKELPEIPKFNRKISSFPIVKRVTPSSNSSAKNIIVPKLKSLEIFNPEIDDPDSSDSDSCGEEEEEDDSTPDSIDSVINTESALPKLEANNGCKITDEITDLSPPLSTKIQSQKNILSNLSGTSKRQHYQLNDFILEENEDTDDDEIVSV